MKNNRVCMWVMVAFITLAANGYGENANDVASTAAPDFVGTRTVLLPEVTKTLQRVCGSDCPAFTILPTYKSSKLPSGSGKLDDLGFDVEDTVVKQLSGISIEVLTNEGLKPEVVASIRNTIAAEAKNHTELPVQVRTKSVASTAGLGDGKALGSKDLLDLAKTSVWPLAALLLGLLGIAAIASFFHQKRKTTLHSHELLNAEKEVEPKAEEVARMEIAALAEEIVDGRLEDLSRLLEQFSYQKEMESLRKVVSLFPGDTLSKKVQLAPVVPVMISKAMAEVGDAQTPGSKQTVEWLKAQLDLVHWKRLREKVEPMAKLSALSSEQLSQVFSAVPSAKGKALVLSFVESHEWPRLLASINSNQKVEVGGSLFQLQQSAQTVDAVTQKEVMETLGRVLGSAQNDKLLNEYVMYLSEEETRELSKNLASSPAFVRPKSMEQILGSLPERQLLELVLGLDVEQIAVLIGKLPAEPQRKLLASLPKKLKERIDTRLDMQSAEEDDTKWLETRSRLMKLYNESHASNLARSIH